MTKQAEKLKKLSSLIQDETLRHIVFNYDDTDEDSFLSDETDCLRYLQNILILSSAVVLRSFLKWKKERHHKESDEFSNSMLRMYNILNRAYDPNKITGDFVDNLIINLVIDHSLNQNEIASFSQTIGIWSYFNFPQANNNLSKYIYMLKQKRISSKYKGEFSFENLLECIQMFSFLRDTEATLEPRGNDDNFIYTVKLKFWGGTELGLNFAFLVAPFGFSYKSYYMYDFEFEDTRGANPIEPQRAKLNFVCFDNTDSFKIILQNNKRSGFSLLTDGSGYTIESPTAVEDFLINYDIINTNSKSETSLFFKDYILLNNKYIKELSLTISDALSKKAKEHILTHLSKYRPIFEKMTVTSFYNGNDTIGRRWDEIVLFLMLEEGIYDFLKLLLQCQDYASFITAFYNRFGKDRVTSLCNADPHLKNAEKKSIFISSKEGRLDFFANALITLATKLLAPDVLNLNKNVYPINIEDVIEDVDGIFKSDKHTEEEKIFCLANSTTNVLLFLDTFYRGVVKYASNKKSAVLVLEDDFGNHAEEYRNYTRAKAVWMDEFKESVSKSSYTAATNDIGIRNLSVRNKDQAAKHVLCAFDTIIETNTEFSKRGSSEAEILYDVLGKRALFDNDAMESFKKAITAAIKNDTAYDLYTKIKRFLYFLKTGNPLAENDSASYAIENAIYPIVGQYFSSVTSRDGYKYSYFKINSFKGASRRSINIKMITDDVFDFGQNYYCVPNINRVAELTKEDGISKSGIWVSPIIIPCSIFIPAAITEIEILSKPEDFDSAIELIYESDPYIYKSFFGSLENAKRVFPELLKTKNCKFYKDNYFIVKENNSVVAIAAMYKTETCAWDTDVIIKAFGNAGVELPATFKSAVAHMEDVFNDCIGSAFYILDDLCVKSSHRRHGIGSSLIWYLIKEAERNGVSLVLSAYAENVNAYSLYTRLGFIPFSKNISNSPDGKDYFKMIKI